MTENTASPDPTTNETMAWVVIASLFAAVTLLQLRDPLPVDRVSLAALFVATVSLLGAALFYRFVRVQDNLSAMCVAASQMLLFSAVGSVLSYMLARYGGALWDDQLRIWDAAIGFDWMVYLRMIDAHPWLVPPLHWAYGSMIPQLIVLLLALGFTRRLGELRCIMLAAILSGTATIILSSFFPAAGNYVHLGLTAADLKHVNPSVGYAPMPDFVNLRNGSMGVLQLPKLQGIIIFPSYHAALATVIMCGFCVSRLSVLQWCGSAIALTTIIATPIDGGHYLVDVVAGVVVGAFSIWASNSAIRWQLRSMMKWSRRATGRPLFTEGAYSNLL